MANPLSSVLGWLRAGYPEGVPPHDVFPLLALLSRTLTPAQLDEVVETIMRENPEREIAPEDVHAAILQITDSPVDPEDMRAVASRLAAAGWPLGEEPGPDGVDEIAERSSSPEPDAAAPDTDAPAAHDADTDGPATHDADTEDAHTEDRPGLTQRIVAWLLAGYPDGVPTTDRVPLIALLRSRISDEEVEQLVTRIIQERRPRPVDDDEVKKLLARYTDEAPLPEDLTRVSAQLAAKGWPLSQDG